MVIYNLLGSDAQNSFSFQWLVGAAPCDSPTSLPPPPAPPARNRNVPGSGSEAASRAGYVMDNAQQWKDILITALKVALLMYVLDRLRLISDLSWVRAPRNGCFLILNQT